MPKAIKPRRVLPKHIHPTLESFRARSLYPLGNLEDDFLSELNVLDRLSQNKPKNKLALAGKLALGGLGGLVGSVYANQKLDYPLDFLNHPLYSRPEYKFSNVKTRVVREWNPSEGMFDNLPAIAEEIRNASSKPKSTKLIGEKMMAKRGTVQKARKQSKVALANALTRAGLPINTNVKGLARTNPRLAAFVNALAGRHEFKVRRRSAMEPTGSGESIYGPQTGGVATRADIQNNINAVARAKRYLAGAKELVRRVSGTRNPKANELDRMIDFGGTMTPTSRMRSAFGGTMTPTSQMRSAPAYDADAAYRRMKRNLGLGILGGAGAGGLAYYMMNRQPSGQSASQTSAMPRPTIALPTITPMRRPTPTGTTIVGKRASVSKRQMLVSGKSSRMSGPKRSIARSNKYM